MKTKIEWATHVWNPVTGCSAVSHGCRNCYAERIAWRFWGARSFSKVMFHPERLGYPDELKTPARIFVNSMGDLFHDNAKEKDVSRIFKVIEKSCHEFFILTKRPERMARAIEERYPKKFPPINLWLGVSAEDQVMFNYRVGELSQLDACNRFVSVEPMLGPVRMKQGHGLRWVICGPETGPGKRRFDIEWAARLYGDCKRLGIPFFYKGESAALPKEYA